MTDHADGEDAGAIEREDGQTCGFCGKGRRDVSILVQGPKGYICDRCVEAATRALDKDLSSQVSIDLVAAESLLRRALTQLPIEDVATGFAGEILSNALSSILVSVQTTGLLEYRVTYEQLHKMADTIATIRILTGGETMPWSTVESLRTGIQRWRKKTEELWKAVEIDGMVVRFAIDTSSMRGGVVFRAQIETPEGLVWIPESGGMFRQLSPAESFYGGMYQRAEPDLIELTATWAAEFAVENTLFKKPITVSWYWPLVLHFPQIGGRDWKGRVQWGSGELSEHVASRGTTAYNFRSLGKKAITVTVDEPDDLLGHVFRANVEVVHSIDPMDLFSLRIATRLVRSRR